MNNGQLKSQVPTPGTAWAFALGDKVRHIFSPPEGVIGLIVARELYETAVGATRYYYVTFVNHDGSPHKDNFRATAGELRKA